jgi:hypothetical protein
MSIEAATLSGALLLILMGKMEVAKSELRPWIHTIPSGNSAQNLVAWSQDEKCGLKYVIHSPGDQPGLQIIRPTLTLGSFKYV